VLSQPQQHLGQRDGGPRVVGRAGEDLAVAALRQRPSPSSPRRASQLQQPLDLLPRPWLQARERLEDPGEVARGALGPDQAGLGAQRLEVVRLARRTSSHPRPGASPAPPLLLEARASRRQARARAARATARSAQRLGERPERTPPRASRSSASRFSASTCASAARAASRAVSAARASPSASRCRASSSRRPACPGVPGAAWSSRIRASFAVSPRAGTPPPQRRPAPPRPAGTPLCSTRDQRVVGPAHASAPVGVHRQLGHAGATQRLRGPAAAGGARRRGRPPAPAGPTPRPAPPALQCGRGGHQRLERLGRLPSA
jgi:hypothetical protein